VSLLEVPPFESLTQGTSPYAGFGPLVPKTEVIENFSQVVKVASARISEMFRVKPSADRAGVVALEELAARIWSEGWDPQTTDVNLFVRDLGSVFMAALQAMTAAEPVFRSKTDLSHASLWWPKQRLEVFPLHKMYRRLTDQDGGGSLVFFVDSLCKKLGV
jgi:hypothetical protein